ncbi:hypothetical protein NW870_08790 [Synechococcus sp. R50.1]
MATSHTTSSILTEIGLFKGSPAWARKCYAYGTPSGTAPLTRKIKLETD